MMQALAQFRVQHHLSECYNIVDIKLVKKNTSIEKGTTYVSNQKKEVILQRTSQVSISEKRDVSIRLRVP